MPSDEELSPEEKLLKVIQDDGQVDGDGDDDSEAATTMIPAPAEPAADAVTDQSDDITDEPDDVYDAESAGDEPERRLQLATRETGESDPDEAESDPEQAQPSDTDDTSSDDSAELIGAGAAAVSEALPASGRTPFSVSYLNKILAVVVFVLIGIAFFEIASGFSALKNELSAIDGEVNTGPGTPSIRGDDIQGVTELVSKLRKVRDLEAKRINMFTPDIIPPPTNAVTTVNYDEILKQNVQVLFTSGNTEVYLKRKRGDDPADFYSVGTDIKILRYIYEVKSVSRESVCFEINGKDYCLP